MITIDSSVRALHLGFVPPKATAPAAAATAPAASAAAGSDDGFSFNDLLDIVNPLQHIPVVGTLYRRITGDTINTVPKIAGDTLYGGLEGFAGSVADTIFEKVTGKSFGDTVLRASSRTCSTVQARCHGCRCGRRTRRTRDRVDFHAGRRRFRRPGNRLGRAFVHRRARRHAGERRRVDTTATPVASAHPRCCAAPPTPPTPSSCRARTNFSWR